MAPQPNRRLIATLTVTITSPQCARYALVDAAGQHLWGNRVYATAEGHAGARKRLARWAEAHGYKVVEHKRRRAA